MTFLICILAGCAVCVVGHMIDEEMAATHPAPSRWTDTNQFDL